MLEIRKESLPTNLPPLHGNSLSQLATLYTPLSQFLLVHETEVSTLSVSFVSIFDDAELMRTSLYIQSHIIISLYYKKISPPPCQESRGRGRGGGGEEAGGRIILSPLKARNY